MNDIKQRLNEELEQIKYQQKIENNLILNESDIRFIFKLLKDNDQELKPMLDVTEALVLRMNKEDYLLMEKHIIDILRYYNLIPNDNLLQCRHKLFFTESKKLVKKSFFGPQSIEKVKDELIIQNIFKKLL